MFTAVALSFSGARGRFLGHALRFGFGRFGAKPRNLPFIGAIQEILVQVLCSWNTEEH